MRDYTSIRLEPKHPNLPREMWVLRDEGMVEAYKEQYPKVSPEKIGRICLAVFRGTEDFPNAPDMDYMGIGRRLEDGTYEWTLLFEQYELVTYLGGVALGKDRQKMYHQMLKGNGFKTAMEKFGWQPQIVVEDEPSDFEIEAYGDWLIAKSPDTHTDLNNA